MIAFTTIGVSDLERARKFYDEIFGFIDAKVTFERPDGKLYGYGSKPGGFDFGICLPANEQDPQPGNGAMIAIFAKDFDTAKAMYEKAIELGATDEGEPGPRLGGAISCCAYVRDLDGNKLNFFAP